MPAIIAQLFGRNKDFMCRKNCLRLVFCGFRFQASQGVRESNIHEEIPLPVSPLMEHLFDVPDDLLRHRSQGVSVHVDYVVVRINHVYVNCNITSYVK